MGWWSIAERIEFLSIEEESLCSFYRPIVVVAMSILVAMVMAMVVAVAMVVAMPVAIAVVVASGIDV